MRDNVMLQSYKISKVPAIYNWNELKALQKLSAKWVSRLLGIDEQLAWMPISGRGPSILKS